MAFDIIFMVVFCWAGYRGYKKGFILQAATLAALILGIYGAVKFSGFTAALIMEKLGTNSEYLPVIAFAITFVAIVVAIHFLAKVIEKLLKMIALSFVNRLLGILFNLIKYAFIISSVLVVLNTINRKTNFISGEKINESILYRPLSAITPMLFPYLHFDFTHPQDAPDAPEKETKKDEILVWQASLPFQHPFIV